MIGLGPLPPPIASVTIPESFHASALALLAQCPLSALHGLPSEERLPPHPRALLGTLVHQVAELAPSSGDAFDVALEQQLAALEGELGASDRTASLVPLRDAVGGLAWRTRIRRARRRILQEGRTMGGSQAPHPQQRATSPPASQAATLGTEVALEDPQLRLIGRLDALRRQGELLVVTEWKTGAIRDAGTGALLERHALQLAAYVRLAEAAHPGHTVFVQIGSAPAAPLPAVHFEHLESVLEALYSRLPPRSELAAREVSHPGPACKTCDIRHRCGSYLASAPDVLWRDSTARRAPLDTWGVVVRVSSAGAHTSIEIDDAAGRRTRIDGLEKRWNLDSVSPGDSAWLFLLESSESALTRRHRLHPVNFHEAPSVAGQSRSHRVQVFWRAG